MKLANSDSVVCSLPFCSVTLFVLTGTTAVLLWQVIYFSAINPHQKCFSESYTNDHEICVKDDSSTYYTTGTTSGGDDDEGGDVVVDAKRVLQQTETCYYAADVTFQTVSGSEFTVYDLPCTSGFQVVDSYDANCSDVFYPGMMAWCQVYEATGEMEVTNSETNVFLIVCAVFFVFCVLLSVGVLVFILMKFKICGEVPFTDAYIKQRDAAK